MMHGQTHIKFTKRIIIIYCHVVFLELGSDISSNTDWMVVFLRLCLLN